jgi:hypothetical protein
MYDVPDEERQQKAQKLMPQFHSLIFFSLCQRKMTDIVLNLSVVAGEMLINFSMK